MRTSACQVSSVQGKAYLDDRKLAAFFLALVKNLSCTENECPICPSTIKGCVRRKPSICICSCAHPFAKKNSAHLIQREGESHLSLAMHCCVRKNIISVFVVVLNFWPTIKMGDSYQKIMTRAPSVHEDTMQCCLRKKASICVCGCVYLLAQKKLGQLSSSENECPICPRRCTPG